jgi:Rap guanine nucleotide exchange factor 1
MEELDLQHHLIFKKDADDMALLGGQIDALIIFATKNFQKISDEPRGAQSIAFGEAFLLTFRTFIDPYDLVDKLIYRYNFFSCQNNDLKQKTAKESFSLLVRVTNDLT